MSTKLTTPLIRNTGLVINDGDYIFITRRGDDDRVFGFGEGRDAKEAYKNMIKNNPASKGIPASGWRLNYGAEGIPVGPMERQSGARSCACGCRATFYAGKRTAIYASMKCLAEDKRRKYDADHRKV
jgi:hypothetical protein